MIFAGIYASAAIPTFLVPAELLGRKFQNQRVGSKDAPKDPSVGSSKDDSSHSKINEESTGDVSHKTLTLSAIEPTSTTNVSPSAPVADNHINSSTSNTAPGITSNSLSRRTSRASRSHSEGHVVAVQGDARGRTGEHHDVIITIPPPTTPAPVITAIAEPPLSELPVLKPPESQPSTIVAVIHIQNEEQKLDISDDKSVAGSDITTAAGSDGSGPSTSANEIEESTWTLLRRLLSDVYVLTFLFLAFLMGVGNGFIGYLFLLLNDYGASGTLLGLCLTMNCIGEVPFFYFSGAIIKKLGVQPALNIAMGAYCLRVGCYAVRKNAHF